MKANSARVLDVAEHAKRRSEADDAPDIQLVGVAGEVEKLLRKQCLRPDMAWPQYGTRKRQAQVHATRNAQINISTLRFCALAR